MLHDTAAVSRPPFPQRREGANPGLVGFTGTLVVTDPVDLDNLGVESVFVAGP